MLHHQELANMKSLNEENQVTNETKIITRISSMIIVRCASVNRAPAIVHELDAEARVQARTLRSAGIILIWKRSRGIV